MLLTIKSPKNTTILKLEDGSELYYYHKPPTTIHTFQDALDLSLWRNYYKPFACMLVSPNQHEIILVRDHLGLSPLYYFYTLGKELIISDTIPELLNQLPTTPLFCQNQINELFSDQKFYSDETIYQGMYRVEPGHLMHFKSDQTLRKIPFWQLEKFGSSLNYTDQRDYLAHFTFLMHEAMQNANDEPHNIAAEYSAGLDSSAIYCAAAANNMQPKLFMHITTPEYETTNKYNDFYEKAFIEHYQLHDIQRIGADNFDPITVFENYATWFAGPAPYLFFMFAHNLHRAVAEGKHRILLSGFGGDQGVSGQIPFNFYIPELIQQQGYRQAWNEFSHHNAPSSHYARLRQLAQYVQLTHPNLYQLSLKIKNMRHKSSIHPYQTYYFNTLREAEWSLLQGPQSHEVRMRIEYSSIVGKKMGFEYRYPLLYPKLLEFILSVPVTQKRHQGQNRYLIRQYLAQFINEEIFKSYRKKDGLGIVPSTFGLFQQQYQQGCYKQLFQNLPYAKLIQDQRPHIKLRNMIKGFMLESYSSHIPDLDAVLSTTKVNAGLPKVLAYS
jgi:asparagine synthetase B (glutamine-hydrolysing)